MRLYYSSNGCSISPHLALEEIGRPFEAERVAVGDEGTRSPAYLRINAKGKTPVLKLDDGTVITENPVILQYLARMNPACQLLPESTVDEFEALQIMELFSNTVHTFGLTRLFRPALFCDSEASWARVRQEGEGVLRKAFDLIDSRLQGRTFLFDRISVADASVFFFEMHASRLKISMPAAVRAHFEAMLARQATQRVIVREDLDMNAYLPADR